MKLFGLDYKLAVGLGDFAAEIVPPFRVKFDISKSADGSAPSKAKIQVYGLSESKRQRIVKNPVDSKHVPVSLSIGYRGDDSQDALLSEIFRGNVDKASVQRDGADVLVDMECLDGGFDMLGGFVSKTIDAGQIVINQILQDMPNTSAGKIAQRDTLLRPKVVVGRPAEVLANAKRAGEQLFIDGEKLYIIKDSETVSAYAPLVSASTGLISVEDEVQQVLFATIINPSIRLGGIVKIESVYSPHLDGVYKVTSMGYKGDSSGREWTQTCSAVRYR